MAVPNTDSVIIQCLFDRIADNNKDDGPVSELLAFLNSTNGDTRPIDKYRNAATIAVESDNAVVLALFTPKFTRTLTRVSLFASMIDSAIQHKSYKCFVFLLQHPAVDVMCNEGLLFYLAIDSRCPYMLARLCAHPSAKLDTAFLRELMVYANSAAALFLEAFIPPPALE